MQTRILADLNSNDLVSVVIPVYNSENFLSESIESVLNQTYKNIEVIAVNDGSTDKSLKILQQYSNRINILSQQNQGLAVAINAGIKKMKGKWFKWFSPDDVLFPEAIETLIKKAKKFPENTVLYSNWEIIDEKDNTVRDFSESDYNPLSNFDYNIRLLDGQQINANTTLIPKSLFTKGCTFRNLQDPVAIDYDFFLRAGIIYDTKFYLIEKNLLKYRIHSNQLSHKNITNTLNYLIKIKEDVLSKLDETQRKEYVKALDKYKRNKPIAKKTVTLGLKILNHFPASISDEVLTFYLNKLRRGR